MIFLIPVALVSAELSTSSPDQGGIFHWVSRSFGEKWGMVAIWLQWINTMIWYPSFLSFVAGTAAYLIDPALVENEIYLVSTILLIFWGMTFLNLFGIRVSAKVNDFCASLGTIFPLFLLIVLGAFWVFSGQPLEMHIDIGTLIPDLTQSNHWVSLIAIMASFLGMELAGVHASDIRDPQRNFPKAVLLSGAFILMTMLLGSMAIAYVLPEQEIHLVAGVMQVFSTFFSLFGLEWCIPMMTLLIVAGTLGGLINWLVSPAKGLMQAAEHGFLPKFTIKKNQWGAPSRILLLQAVFVSLFCSVFLLVPSVNGFYWFLTALSTSLYMFMYALMFLSALVSRLRGHTPTRGFRVPGGLVGLWVATLLGIFACGATVVVSFLPPDHVDIGSSAHYSLLIGGGTIVSFLPLLFFFYIKRKKTAH